MNISPPSHKYTCMFLILGTAYIYAIIYIDITLVFFSLIWHRSFFFLPTTLIFVINGFPIWSKFITSISSSTTPNTDCASIFNHLWNYTSPSTHFILYACSRILVIVCAPPLPSVVRSSGLWPQDSDDSSQHRSISSSIFNPRFSFFGNQP